MAVACALVLTGCAMDGEREAARRADADRELADALKGRVAGTPVDCVSASGLSGPRVIDGRAVLYTQGRRVWRADLPDGCPSLGPFDTLVVELHGSQICRSDRFRVLDPGTTIPGPYCRFGKFTPYVRP